LENVGGERFDALFLVDGRFIELTLEQRVVLARFLAGRRKRQERRRFGVVAARTPWRQVGLVIVQARRPGGRGRLEEPVALQVVGDDQRQPAEPVPIAERRKRAAEEHQPQREGAAPADGLFAELQLLAAARRAGEPPGDAAAEDDHGGEHDRRQQRQHRQVRAERAGGAAGEEDRPDD
jgi:hypothetical protein